MNRILLLGANGQVGWELQRALAPLGELLVCDRRRADLADPEGLARLVRAERPQFIVNAGAYTAVDKAESDADNARLINARAVAVLAEEAAACGAWLVHYSTDYVFDGAGSVPFAEDAPTGPLSVYGQTKLEGEQAIRASGCRHLIFRTSWVYAARGGNFAKTMLRLAGQRDELKVVADQFGAPTSAELIADGNGVQGAAAGVPFPLPQSGQEAIWNHIMRYRGEQLHLQTNQAAVLANGSYNLLKLDRYLYFVYGREGMIPENLDNTLFYYKYKVVAPARLAGSALVVQETLDQVLSIRKAWRFNRGERRVRRLPTLAYDSLQPDTNGMATADTVDVYNGAPDHYEWALLGKREMLVPYNSYAVHQKGLAYGDILKSRFINPDLLRYELHRVWVVEATLRKGFSHPYAKRRFYLDEDSWQILAADIYDKDGVLTRAQEVHPINYYDVPLVSSTLEAIYDFKGGRYFVDGLDNNEPMYDFGVQVGPRDFTPQALRREGN
ncbi:dTDP-4-dehydrorhamnose reductase [Pseudomonas aeruginosa]|nr:dTDP-4-dehydrorhamnose reductase [Pseudomonas aeruginosa]